MSDALTQLRSALAPKPGMKRIPFPLESYEHPSLPLVSKRLINLMAEKAPDDARVAAALVPTPALQDFQSIGAGPILAMNDDMPGRVYVVSGTHFYRISFPLGGGTTVEDLGDVGTADTGTGSWNSFATIAAGPTAVAVCVPPNVYIAGNDVGDPIGIVTDPAFPGASSVAYVGGYFAFSALGNTSEWFISRLLDPTVFDALDFAFSDALPNVIRRVISHRGQLWTIGEGGFQIWYQSGDADFPFRPAAGGVIAQGTASPMSVCRADQSVWWLGLDGTVYRSEGYSAKRVSTHAVEAILSAAVVGLYALTHPFRGHWFYCVTSDGGRTLVYDVATAVWHERSSTTDGIGPWRALSAAVDNNTVHLFGDRSSGMLFKIDRMADDAGVIVIRQATLPPLWGGTNRAFCARAEIEMEAGGADTPGAVLLEWSDDGSRTWGPSRTMSAGLAADTRHRVYTTRLGSFRQRTFRFTTHGLTTFYAMDADITAGAS